MGATIINTIIGLVIGALFTALVNRIKYVIAGGTWK